MKKKDRNKKTLTQQRQEKLAWVINEWDCFDLEDAKVKAQTDAILHRVLRENGVKF